LGSSTTTMTTDWIRSVDMAFQSPLAKIVSSVGWLGAALALAAPACPPAAPKAQPYHVYQWSTSSGIEAADFAPRGSRVAAVVLGEPVGRDPRAPLRSTLLQIWDFRTGRLVLEKPLATTWSWTWPQSAGYVNGGKEFAYCDGATVHIFETGQYGEVRRIALGQPPGGTDRRFAIMRYAASSDGGRFAVLLGQQQQDLGYGGEVSGVVAIRVYDSVSRKLVREWSFTFKDVVPLGFALSPDGSKVGWTRVGESWSYRRRPPAKVENLQVLDVPTGKVLGINTGRQEGELAFSSDDRLLSISWNSALRSARHDGIKIWDAQTGKLLGVISSSPNGVHHRLAVSDDGRIVLGFVGRDKTNENFVDFDQQQFSLWDLQTRKLLFTSPLIHGVAQPVYGPKFRLSPDGRLVLVWWPGRTAVRVYEPLSMNGPSDR
jgi:hypothetical protein